MTLKECGHDSYDYDSCLICTKCDKIKDTRLQVAEEMAEALQKISDDNPCVRRLGCPDCTAREALEKWKKVSQ